MSGAAPRFALVLGGGGLRGLAHVGALQELDARGWEPAEVIGSSIGALVAAAWAFGYTLGELESIARSIKRRDVFRIAHTDMAFKRMHSPALYRTDPLDHLVRGLFGEATFADLPRRLMVGSVEINSGMQIFWGLPGLTHARVADAVFASCALPGFFPPRQIDGRWWVDGALVDNLPVRLAASRGHEAVVAVDVGASDVLRADVQDAGFAALFARASEVVFEQAKEWHLGAWHKPPMLLVQPRVEHVPMFSFDHTRELIAEGRRATAAAMDEGADAVCHAKGGIYPRRRVKLGVLKERCIGCGSCVAMAPAGYFRMDGDKAIAREDPVTFSPMDGAFVRHCPAWAITVQTLPAAAASTGDGSRDTAPVRA